MHSYAHHHKADEQSATGTTKGLILNRGWHYDLTVWFRDTFFLRGQMRRLRQRAIDLAHLQRGEHVLDVGCGTGTLALIAGRRVGRTGRVVGIDPGAEPIAYARKKAAWRHVPVEFQIGVIEQLAFPAQTFDVVFSTLMMHHLPGELKRQGLAEVARVLKPGGRLVIADFQHKQERQGRAVHFPAGGSRMQDLAALVADAGFEAVETEEMQPLRFSAFPGAGIVYARKGANSE